MREQPNGAAAAPGIGAAAGIVLAALLLRLPWLGRLGPFGDEDITLLVARGIRATGWPQLPSGHFYWRAPLYHYLVAPLASGDDLFRMRLLSVFASALCAFLVYRMGRRFWGTETGVAGAILFCTSVFEIYTSRQARFYAPYQVIALLAIGAIHRLWEQQSRTFPWTACTLVLISMGFHEIGATLAVGFGLAALRQRDTRRALWLLAMVPVLGCVSLLQQSVERTAIFGGAKSLAAEQDVLSRTDIGNVAAKFLSLSLKSVSGQHQLEKTRMLLLVCMGILGLSLGLFGTRNASLLGKIAGTAGIFVSLLAAGSGNLGLAMGLLLALLLVRAEVFPGPPARPVLLAAGAIVGASGAAWLTAKIGSGEPIRDALVSLAGQPVRLAFPLLRTPLLASVPATAGAVVVLARSWRGSEVGPQRFLYAFLASSILVRSMLGEKEAARYTFDLRPVWELLGGWVMIAAMGAATRRARSHSTAVSRLPMRLRLAGLGAALFLFSDTSPAATIPYLRTRPGQELPSLLGYPRFVPDIGAAAAWLEPRIRPGERVAATDWLTTYACLGRLDGWIRSGAYEHQSVRRNGEIRDVYLGVPVLRTVASLEEWAEAGPVWIVVGGLELEVRDSKLDPQLRAWLRAREPLYLARDGSTRVLLLVPQDKSVLR